MTMRYSTGIRDKNLGLTKATVHGAIAANTISFDNASGEIRDSGNGFLTAGFLVGDVASAFGTASNNTDFTVTSAAAGVLVVTPAPSTEAAGTVFALAAATGGSIRDIMRNFVLRFYSGTQPDEADDAIPGTSTLLLEYTESGGTFVHGAAANGLNLGASTSATIDKAATETWKATGLGNGTVGWWRACANPADNGLESTTLDRIDGSAGTAGSGADAIVAITSIALDKVYYANSMLINFPYQYGA